MLTDAVEAHKLRCGTAYDFAVQGNLVGNKLLAAFHTFHLCFTSVLAVLNVYLNLGTEYNAPVWLKAIIEIVLYADGVFARVKIFEVKFRT